MKDLLLPSILITFMYFISGFSKINNFTQVSVDFANKLRLADSLMFISKFIILLVILLEILGPVFIVTHNLVDHNSWKNLARISSLALAAFTVLATVLYHFPPTGNNYRPFLSNLVAVGAFLVLSRI
jgi:uncharacterized membrane protein YphA (DoxX/SURF4 family)